MWWFNQIHLQPLLHYFHLYLMGVEAQSRDVIKPLAPHVSQVVDHIVKGSTSVAVQITNRRKFCCQIACKSVILKSSFIDSWDCHWQIGNSKSSAAHSKLPGESEKIHPWNIRIKLPCKWTRRCGPAIHTSPSRNNRSTPSVSAAGHP